MRFLNWIAGLACVILALFMGLFALVGFFSNNRSEDIYIAAFFGGIAFILLVIGRRWMCQSRSSTKSAPTNEIRGGMTKPTNSSGTKLTERPHTGLKYEDFTFGNPPPTRKQFGYAMSLGADVHDGMTKWMISDAIDEAIENQRSDEPATQEQLREIRNYHGVLPRKVTRGEARKIIDFLQDYTLSCPFCGVEVFATDDVCCACNKSLRKMRIPISI